MLGLQIKYLEKQFRILETVSAILERNLMGNV
jgi:hypothetical protein